MSLRPLREHQTTAIEMLRESLRTGHRRPMLQLPTGAGKTRVAAEIIINARSKGHRVVFTVPAISLVDQTVERFWEDGVRDVGVIQADHPNTDWSRPVQVASIQTLSRRSLPEATLVIVDEAHRHFERMSTWMAYPHWKTIPFIGLSATPWTKGLGKYYDDLLIPTTMQELIEKGFLSEFKVFAPTLPDLSGVRMVAGDYHEEDLAKAMNKEALVGDVVEQWIKLGDGRSTFCYGVDCAHAQHIQSRFNAVGITCGYQDANTPTDERKALMRQFRRGDMPIICNVGTLTTGVDEDVRCISFARPTRSKMLFVQIVGRMLRPAPGKEDAFLIDHTGTSFDPPNGLGFVTDIYLDRLDDGKPKSKVEKEKEAAEREGRLPKKCPSCSCLKPVGTRKCPNCGFEPIVQTAIEHIDGELVELTKKGKPKQTALPGHVRMHGTEIPHAQFYAELLGHAAEKGFQRGWAFHKFREKVGEMPPRGDPKPATPSYEVASWIRSQQIRYAKGKAKTEGGRRSA